MQLSAKRESIFRCTFSSPASTRVAHVRAWDAGEAVQLFRAELQTDGVEELGTIEVQPFGAATEQPERAAYAP